MDLVDKFLETVTDEFGNKIDFSNVEKEGFSGAVYFGENSIEIFVDDVFKVIGQTNITNEEYKTVEAFTEYVQQKMKEHKQFLQDDINTKNSLYNYGKL